MRTQAVADGWRRVDAHRADEAASCPPCACGVCFFLDVVMAIEVHATPPSLFALLACTLVSKLKDILIRRCCCASVPSQIRSVSDVVPFCNGT